MTKKKYKIQKLGDRYILLKRKSRWNALGFVALSIATLGILNFADWVLSLDGQLGGFMDFEAWTWEYLGSFDSTELAVEAKQRNENFSSDSDIKEYYL